MYGSGEQTSSRVPSSRPRRPRFGKLASLLDALKNIADGFQGCFGVALGNVQADVSIE